MPRHGLFVLSLFLGVAACDQSRPTAPTSDIPALGTGNGPDHPGHSFVFRSNDGIFLSTVDDAQGLVVRHYNTEEIDFCGGADVFPTAEAQIVFTPGAAVYTWKTGTIPVYIYLLSEVPPGQEPSEQFCSDLKNKWIYKGTHSLTNHDNNLFFELGRTNAFGFNGQGIVFDQAGKKFSYRESFLAAITPTLTGNPPPNDIIGVERNARYSLSIK
jgi:hypothetical protein